MKQNKNTFFTAILIIVSVSCSQNINSNKIEEAQPATIVNEFDEIETKYKKTLQMLEKYKRTAFIPITEKVERNHSCDSKIGGLPYLRHEQDWPVCPNCKKNMQLFLQLNLKELPKKKANGIAQLFYCTTQTPLCEVDMDAFFPFSKSVVARVVNGQSESAVVSPKIDNLFEEKRITSWQIKNDYPHYEEFEQLGIEIDYSIYDLMEERKQGVPLAGDKLFGWPYWVQAAEYPYDRKSGEQMQLLFQLDSEVNLPHMFGDAGIGHLTQSPSDSSELGFGWACH